MSASESGFPGAIPGMWHFNSTGFDPEGSDLCDFSEGRGIGTAAVQEAPCSNQVMTESQRLVGRLPELL